MILSSLGFVLFSLISLFSPNVQVNGLIIEYIKRPRDYCALEVLYEIGNKLDSVEIQISCETQRKMKNDTMEYISLCYNDIMKTSPGMICGNVTKNDSIIMICTSSFVFICVLIMTNRMQHMQTNHIIQRTEASQNERIQQPSYEIPMQEIIIHDSTNIMIGENKDNSEKYKSNIAIIANP